MIELLAQVSKDNICYDYEIGDYVGCHVLSAKNSSTIIDMSTELHFFHTVIIILLIVAIGVSIVAFSSRYFSTRKKTQVTSAKANKHVVDWRTFISVAGMIAVLAFIYSIAMATLFRYTHSPIIMIFEIFDLILYPPNVIGSIVVSIILGLVLAKSIQNERAKKIK